MNAATSAQPSPDDDLLTLDELTVRVGLSVRNVRFYTSRGLVPAPIRIGRSGYYSADHVARLELVQELQGHGFTLAAIERYVAGIPADATAADVALQSAMLTPWHSDRPVTMTHTELEQRADRTLDDDAVDVLLALSIVRREGSAYAVSVPRLSVGLGLLDLGFPIEAARAASDVYLAHGRAIAHELYDVFRHLAWPAYKEAGATPETIQRVVEDLKPLSVSSLIDAYEQGMDETKRENITHRAR